MDLQKLMAQAQKMQRDMEKTQKELELLEYEATAGGNAVKVRMNGSLEILDIELDEEVMQDKEMLIDLLKIATNSVIVQVETDKANKMGALTGGLKVPGVR